MVNLGFSGHGLMQAEVANLLTEVDASVYVAPTPFVNSDVIVTSALFCTLWFIQYEYNACC
jgi:hypothetical protein